MLGHGLHCVWDAREIPEGRARRGAITCCDECKRQYANYRLGAPVSELDFQPGIGRKKILANFSDAAEQGLTWSQARSRIGWEYGLIKNSGQAVDKTVVAMLRIARRFFRDSRDHNFSRS
jgi:hypothetical protein